MNVPHNQKADYRILQCVKESTRLSNINKDKVKGPVCRTGQFNYVSKKSAKGWTFTFPMSDL